MSRAKLASPAGALHVGAGRSCRAKTRSALASATASTAWNWLKDTDGRHHLERGTRRRSVPRAGAASPAAEQRMVRPR
jgi:hypothetical protein